jgi:hypothetical protein
MGARITGGETWIGPTEIDGAVLETTGFVS